MRFTRLVTLAAALVAMCGFSAARAVASSPVSFSSATVELDDPCDGGGIMTTGDLTAPKFVSVPEEIELKGLLIETVSGGLAFVHFQGTGPDYEGLGHYQGIFNGAASLGLSGGITVPFAGLIHNQIEGETIGFNGSLYLREYGNNTLGLLSQLIYVDNAVCIDKSHHQPA